MRWTLLTTRLVGTGSCVGLQELAVIATNKPGYYEEIEVRPSEGAGRFSAFTYLHRCWNVVTLTMLPGGGAHTTRDSHDLWIGGIARHSLGQDETWRLECVTANTRPDLDEEASNCPERWPEFIFHCISRAYVDRAEQYFPEYQVLLLDDGRVAAGGWGVPFAYEGRTVDLPDGYDGALVCAIDGHEAGNAPTAFSFMAAAVHRDYDKRGLAGSCSSAPPPAPATPG